MNNLVAVRFILRGSFINVMSVQQSYSSGYLISHKQSSLRFVLLNGDLNTH